VHIKKSENFVICLGEVPSEFPPFVPAYDQLVLLSQDELLKHSLRKIEYTSDTHIEDLTFYFPNQDNNLT
jgi:hypothetical protein